MTLSSLFRLKTTLVMIRLSLWMELANFHIFGTWDLFKHKTKNNIGTSGL
jgi:hypothetical protein